ncbi:hypothetical protein J6524_16410 [Bradyrhizobium sp. WSM 1738]|uniref:hypothetical protein n=1 Tax=Bradyrhizobium hereditatis TaxID=2821405 RepID=UPI001CE380B2|nr:hypothetical protein [Bradyrhizobium hereditatis]MCA6116470.1 hypothetical protein [Bradyrhizobium hereditatis]
MASQQQKRRPRCRIRVERFQAIDGRERCRAVLVCEMRIRQQPDCLDIVRPLALDKTQQGKRAAALSTRHIDVGKRAEQIALVGPDHCDAGTWLQRIVEGTGLPH